MPPLVANKPSAASNSVPFSDAEIAKRIDACPKLASLSSINRALGELLKSDLSFNSQIAEVIRRDPSLTARLLRMVNSVFFDLTAKVNNIEEAVFYLGLRQIRELAKATPVIEDMERLQNTPSKLPWRELWKHSIGSAIMTREILAENSTLLVDDDTDYIIGLLHNVGKVVLATAFPDQFARVVERPARNTIEVCAIERELIGWDHARVGGYYLQRHRVAPEIVSAVLYHNDPENAGDHTMYAAAVQVADQLVRFAGIRGGFEDVEPMKEEAWSELQGWKILFGSDESAQSIARAALSHSLQRLPMMLNGLV
ncbi:MAG: HDOD domain-containing protein [Opitutaceae bacterium]|jgi:HD-like signal output (HDOD) protein